MPKHRAGRSQLGGRNDARQIFKDHKHWATSGYVADPSKQVWKTFSTLDNLQVFRLVKAAVPSSRKQNVKVTLIKHNQMVLQGSAAPGTGEEPLFDFNSSHYVSAKYKTMTQ